MTSTSPAPNKILCSVENERIVWYYNAGTDCGYRFLCIFVARAYIQTVLFWIASGTCWRASCHILDNLPVLGRINTQATHGHCLVPATFYIVKSGNPLMGMDLISSLNLCIKGNTVLTAKVSLRCQTPQQVLAVTRTLYIKWNCSKMLHPCNKTVSITIFCEGCCRQNWTAC